MPPPGRIPGDVLIVDSNDAAPGQKLPRSKPPKDTESSSSADSSPSIGSPPISKKARTGTAAATGHAVSSQPSEQGGVEKFQDQSGANTDNAVKPKLPVEASHQAQASQCDPSPSAEATAGVVMPPEPPTWSTGSHLFKLPVFSEKREGSWLARFADWVHVFYRNNLHHRTAMTPSIVLAAYTYFMDSASGLNSGKRKSGKKAAQAASKSGELSKTLRKCRAAGPHAQAAQTSAGLEEGATRQTNQAPVPLESKKAARGKLPKGAAAEKEISGAVRDGRPPNDMNDAEPELHEDKDAACFLCGSTEHPHDNCRNHWAHVDARGGPPRKVVDIPITCAICGSRQHYLSECPDRVNPPNPSWSLATRSRFIDPDCGVLCVEDALKQRQGLQQPPATAPTMRGPMARTSNVHYSESDDTDMDFLGNRIVEQQGQASQMRMSIKVQARGSAQSSTLQHGWPSGLPLSGPSHGQPSAESRGTGHASTQPGAGLPAKPPRPR